MPFSRLRRTAAAFLVLAALSGCSELDKASAAGINHNDLMTDMATQLADATDVTYEATYQLSGGATATIAHEPQPARTAYVYQDGLTLVTADTVTECTTTAGPATCTMTTPAPTSPSPAAAILPSATVTAPGLVPTPTVQALLNRAALDPEAQIEQRDTTIAGRHATCVKLGGAEGTSDFDTCITNEGILGSFSGVVGQAPFDMTMTHYSDTIAEVTFTLPAGAKIIDHRQ
ncbi:hypothetical protein [Actinoplanes sp. NPDC051494]|uniref:hypothetical protein n=1 Tax=Actinoplanes sp. NPDC051494 TaxID=3363907 RepID=UPI0037B2420D